MFKRHWRLYGYIGTKYRVIYLLTLLMIIFIVYICNGLTERIDMQISSSCKSTSEKNSLISVCNLSIKNSTSAIAFLYNEQILDLIPKIVQLDRYFSDNMSSDIIIFQTGYSLKRDLETIANTTKRQITFYNVDAFFTSFPDGFDPYLEEPTWTKRGKWSYHHMCRFWFKHVTDIPLVNKYDYLMRLDSDSGLLGNWFNIFNLMEKKNIVYFGNVEESDSENVLPGLMKLKSFTLYYKKKYKKIPKDPLRLMRAFETPGVIRLYNTNFDVIKIRFFRAPEIRHWVNAVDSTYGIFRYRWGDHVLRYITTAMFASPEEVLLRTDFNLSYCHPC